LIDVPDTIHGIHGARNDDPLGPSTESMMLQTEKPSQPGVLQPSQTNHTMDFMNMYEYVIKIS
jgi:hypothetical protein